MKIQFLGAAQTVTGSRHLLTTQSGFNILLDCGLYQSQGTETDKLNRHLGFDPLSIDCVLLSHAHIDHSGDLPNLVKQGYKRAIFATPATVELCSIMLADSAKIQENDVAFVNKHRIKEGRELIKPLYSQQDVKECMELMREVDYHQWIHLAEDVSFMFTDAGHILGSACIHIRYTENGRTYQISYTGDIGRPQDLLLKAPEKFPQADFIICESTYGNRLHAELSESQNELLKIVKETCIEKKGKLLIPAFSLGRTQELVYTLDRLKNAGQIPGLKVFVDSPLSTNATGIMRKYARALNENVQKHMETDEDPFGFNQLQYLTTTEESMMLNDFKEPCIIISASGMLEAGRIKHHLKNHISNPHNTLLLVGYCAPRTLGDRLLRGDTEVKIFGKMHTVKMQIVQISSYSAHADYREMIDFLNCQNPRQVKEIFLVHGEMDSQQFYRQMLLEKGFEKVYIPLLRENVVLQ